MAHEVVKPEKIAAVAAVSLEQNLVLPAVMHREGIEQYKGAEGDTITVKVPGVLPYRSYGWRNDRSASIQFDEYKERKVAVTFGDDIYSAVRLTDEQNDFDLDGWTKLMAAQTKAVGRGLERGAVNKVLNAPYEITLKLDSTKLRTSLIKARNVMDRLMVPDEQRIMLLGSDVEAALLDDDKVFGNAAQVGESDAESALRRAILADRYGFTFIKVLELPPTTAIAMVSSAFIFASGAPSVPQSVGFGAAASYEGVALRWIRDYDMEKTRDRSLVNTYPGFREVVDTLVGVDAENQAFVSNYEHFVRAFKLVLDGTEVLPDPDGDDEKATELGNITGIWAASNATASADAATVPASTEDHADGTAVVGTEGATPTNRRSKAKNEA
ncbi:hypothetical protein [Kribbella sindirgiensis]|uniref:hypothetical protein n=1 Tax=Kribbella sindirgiensis TaxID=1124744 RepID=UPI00192D7899|nr:hypothetical protein [Kribbella sindirgiensis]